MLKKRLVGADGSGGDDLDRQGETSGQRWPRKPAPRTFGRAGSIHETSPRFKPWRSIMLESTQETTSDSVVSGLATAQPVYQKMLQIGGDPKRWFAEWAKELSIGWKDGAQHEMHTLIDIFCQEG